MRYNIYLGQIEKAHTKRKLEKLLELIRHDLAIIFSVSSYDPLCQPCPFLSSVGFVVSSITEQFVKVNQKIVVDFWLGLCYE